MIRKLTDEEEAKLHRAWYTINRNCTDKTAQDYKIYGGKGIKVCKQWKDYSRFSKWAIENGFELGKVLQRKDKSGNFTPENCYYVDKSERNTDVRSNSFTVEYNGKVYTNESFAREVNINPRKTLRLLRDGKTAEEIVAARSSQDKYICYGHSSSSSFLTEDAMPNQHGSRSSKLYTINGVTAPLADLCKLFGNGITRKEAQRRISKGWSPEDAVLVPVIRVKKENEDE